MTECPAKVLSFLRPLLYSREWSNSFSFIGNLCLLLARTTKHLVPVVQTLDSAIQRLNNWGQGSFKFSRANIWNMLPLALRSEHDLNKFGFGLKGTLDPSQLSLQYFCYTWLFHFFCLFCFVLLFFVLFFLFIRAPFKPASLNWAPLTKDCSI